MLGILKSDKSGKGDQGSAEKVNTEMLPARVIAVVNKNAIFGMYKGQREKERASCLGAVRYNIYSAGAALSLFSASERAAGRSGGEGEEGARRAREKTRLFILPGRRAGWRIGRSLNVYPLSLSHSRARTASPMPPLAGAAPRRHRHRRWLFKRGRCFTLFDFFEIYPRRFLAKSSSWRNLRPSNNARDSH